MVVLIVQTFSLSCNGKGQQFGFNITDSLPQAGAGLAGVRADCGKIYVIGGYGYFLNMIPVASNLVRVYDIEQGKWEVSRAKLRTPRMYSGSAICGENSIVVAGGVSQNNMSLASVEIYNSELEESPQETVTCKYIGNMSAERRNPVLNVLNDGRVLVSGNSKQSDIIEKDSEGEYVIRATKGKMHFERSEHATVKLKDGRICFIAGRRKSIEIFDPKTEIFTLMNSKFSEFYDDQAAELLYNGKILIAGGQDIMANKCTGQTWIYDPENDKLVAGPKLVPGALGVSCDGVSDLQIVDLDKTKPGTVLLLCGGEDDTGTENDIVLDSAWLYLALQNEFVEVGPMCKPHDDFLAFALPEEDGKLRALVIAGHTTGDKVSDICEIFHYAVERD